ncbi:MAG: homocysteine S-methyltransferase family protein [Acidobacteriota bacterium]
MRLQRGDVLLGDGAWGTMLMQRGLRAGEPPDMACISQPGAIEEIAALYLESGAEIITTNTFGASPLKLQMFGLDERTEEINRKSVEAARRAVGTRACVSASVGPTGRLLKPYGDVEAGEVQAGFERQVRALAEAGADLICVETMTDLAEAVLAVQAARAVAPAAPVMATVTFEATPRGFRTIMGVTVEQAAAGLEEAGADILGSNCGNGIETMIEIAREFRRHSRLPVAIQSNAGLPALRSGILIYPESPEFMAERVPQLLAAGVQIIGGCCGTTPAHIAALRKTIDSSRQ